MEEKNYLPPHLEEGVDWSTDSRSSFLVHTKMGPSKLSGTDSPRRTRRSWPVPMSCKALPTLPPPTMTAGATLVAGAAMVVAMAEALNLKAEVVGEMEKDSSEVAMKEWVISVQCSVAANNINMVHFTSVFVWADTIVELSLSIFPATRYWGSFYPPQHFSSCPHDLSFPLIVISILVTLVFQF